MFQLRPRRLDYPVLFSGQILFLLFGHWLWADGLVGIGRILLVVLFLASVIATTGGSRRFVLVSSISGTLAVCFLESARADLHLMGAILMTALLIHALVRVLLDVLNHHTVRLGTLFGSLSGYLLLGSAFAMMYYAMESTLPGSFHLHDVPLSTVLSGGELVPALSYFSVVTLTTLGFGDILPATPLARSLVGVEALFGQIFLVVLVARLVSAFDGSREELP